MKKIVFICIALFCIFVFFNQTAENKTKIAILTPITHPSLEHAEMGFKATMEASHPGKYQFDTYNAQGNKTLMRSEIEEIAQKNYDLVFTIATSSSQMAVEVFNKKGLNTPIVFTCVNDPVGFQIVSNEENPGGNVTGIKEMVRFDEELAALLKYKPAIKTILLVYNPMEPGLQKDQKAIEKTLQEKGIKLETAEVFQSNEIFAKVSPFISDVDAVVVLKDNCVVSALDSLIKLCNVHRIPLMASDLDSPDRGAAFGYGVYEINFGIEGAKKALQILDDRIKPGVIPVTPVTEFMLRINAEAAKRQGIELS